MFFSFFSFFKKNEKIMFFDFFEFFDFLVKNRNFQKKSKKIDFLKILGKYGHFLRKWPFLRFFRKNHKKCVFLKKSEKNEKNEKYEKK